MQDDNTDIKHTIKNDIMDLSIKKKIHKGNINATIVTNKIR